SGWIHGGIHCRYQAWEAAAEQALVHYRLAGSPASTRLGQIGAALYWGPTSVISAIDRGKRLFAQDASDPDRRADVHAYLGGLEAEGGKCDQARSWVAEARLTWEDMGHEAGIAIHCDGVRGDIELAAGDYPAAEEALRAACAYFESTNLRGELATRAADLAE